MNSVIFALIIIGISGCSHGTRNPAQFETSPRLEALAVPPLDVTDYKLSTPKAIKYTNFGYDLLIDEDQGIVAFELRNNGGNRIVPKKEFSYDSWPERDYTFVYPGRGRRDVALELFDSPTSTTSHGMSSIFVFLPRKVIPAIEPSEDRSVLKVTLPTEETVRFDASTREIIDGVLTEGKPIDLGPDKNKRIFADVTYTGVHVLIRANRRGTDARIASIATVQKGEKICKIPSKELWEQAEGTGLPFRFATDEEADAFLKKKCGFGVF